MKALEPAVPARYFAQLIDFLESVGAPCRDALSAAQIRSLNDPKATLTASQVEALVAEAGRLTGRGDMGFELGKLIKLNSHDILGFAIISCPTIDHLLRLTARYYRLMTPMFVFQYRREGDFADIQFRPALAMSEPTMHFYLELLAVSFHVQLMAVTQGRVAPYDIHVSMPAPPHATRYRELKPARVHFEDQDFFGVRIHMGTELFDAPLPMADLRALGLAEAKCKLLMQEFDVAGSCGAWVAMMLREAEDCQPTLDELASILNISTRTLDRHLEKEGLRFRELAVRVRNERACQMLADGNQSISQIAYRLGYTDIANFSRSFKRLNGASPSDYMARLRSEGGRQVAK